MNPLSKTLNYGMGVFETIRLKDNQLEYLEAHLERLSQSIETLDVSYNISQEKLETQLINYCSDNDITEGVVKLVIADTEPEETISHRINPYSAAHYREGFSLSISDIKRHSSNPLWQHKTTNYWLNIMVKNTAGSSEEILFLNEAGHITEGTVSNVFVVKDNVLMTPELSCGLLPGIMRQKVIESCKVLNIRIESTCLTTEDLLESDSLFITNSIMGIMPVSNFIGFPKTVTPIVNELMEVLNGS